MFITFIHILVPTSHTSNIQQPHAPSSYILVIADLYKERINVS